MQRVNNFCGMGRQRGIGLIEVLIAVLVLSIGFLGMAALQAKSLADNNSAMMRTQASIAAYTMFDAMRADRANAVAQNYNRIAAPVTVGACPTATGTLAELQIRDWCLGFDPSNPPLSSWVGAKGTYSVANPPPTPLLGGLAAVEPGASAQINCLAPTNGASNCSITITFDDSRATGGNAAQTLVFWSQL